MTVWPAHVEKGFNLCVVTNGGAWQLNWTPAFGGRALKLPQFGSKIAGSGWQLKFSSSLIFINNIQLEQFFFLELSDKPVAGCL